ncbi:MAG: SDR family oxidoreductase [Hyphomonadaceae bacterium]
MNLGETLNPVGLITGAAGAQGAACARALAARCSGGLILVDANEAALAATADALPDAPERVSTLTFDAADPPSWWLRASDFIKAQYGRLDWAVVSAAAAQSALEGTPSPADIARAIDSDLDAAFATMRPLMAMMRNNSEGGALVLLTTTTALKGDAALGQNGDLGLAQLMRVAAKEGAADSIRINAVTSAGALTAGLRGTPLYQDLLRELGGARAALEAIAKRNPPIARYAAAESATRLVALLLAERTALTGATLVVDGGYTI